MSTYAASDPATNLILDFIAGGVPGTPSGESKGNYNAVIGDADATQDLSKMTLAQIRNLQNWLLGEGEPSSAVGRYQGIKTTLTGFQRHKGLPDSTLFTDELQDEFGLYLLVSRGYRAWYEGRTTNADLAHGMACEWASLPDPLMGGKSHYDGVGPNHASTTLSELYAALDRARTLIKP